MHTSSETFLSSPAFADQVKTALNQAFTTEELRDAGQKLSAEERLLSVIPQDQGCQLQVASDGLSLDQKERLERMLMSQLAAHIPSDARVTVYFKRKSPLANPIPASQSAPERALPFGLKRNRQAIPGVRDIILVASGKGGVGKSTVSINLAVALARAGHKVGLLDADIYGPSAPMMLGMQGPMGVAPGNRILPVEGHGVKVVSFGFLTDIYSPMISRGPVVSKGIKQLCYQTDWGDTDYLVVDLPPGTGDIQMTLIEDLPIRAAVIVSTPQNVALLDAHKALTMFEKLNVPVLGIVENMAYHACSHCGHEDQIFGAETAVFAKQRALPIIARVPLKASVRADADAGKPIAEGDGELAGIFAALATRITESAKIL